jgi:hypothetical protein
MQHMKEFLERTNSVIKNPNLKTVGSKIWMVKSFAKMVANMQIKKMTKT